MDEGSNFGAGVGLDQDFSTDRQLFVLYNCVRVKATTQPTQRAPAHLFDFIIEGPSKSFADRSERMYALTHAALTLVALTHAARTHAALTYAARTYAFCQHSYCHHSHRLHFRCSHLPPTHTHPSCALR